MKLSNEEIERRRENANQLVAEGRLGGAEYGRLGGRPRIPRASEVIAQEVATDGMDFYTRLKEIVETGNDGMAISSIRTLLEIEEKERKIEEEREMKFEELKRDELIKFLAGAITELQGQNIDFGTVVDAEFESVEHRQIEGTSESDSSPTE